MVFLTEELYFKLLFCLVRCEIINSLFSLEISVKCSEAKKKIEYLQEKGIGQKDVKFNVWNEKH